jgi:monothiol glutaredoxin
MTDNPAHERIANDVAENDVLLFMKGTPVFPQCGFSALVVKVLSNVGVKFKAVDVLKDADIRNGVKEYSFRSFMLKANSWVAATSLRKCMKAASWSLT